MKKLLAILLPVLLVAFVACEDEPPTAITEDQAVSAGILIDLQNAHPVPKFDRSQLRQNLVELTIAQAQTTQTTTFFFNLGISEPVNNCPSIGFPIPATAQLTNPDQRIPHYRGAISLPQVEPTGVYTGDTTGTYVMCVDAEGQAYAVYWEGFVQAITGPAEWTGSRIELIGPPSFNFSEGG